jgi:signal transduction histidine kinase
MSEEGIQKIFKLFGQVKSVKKINQTGIGLGLAICKALVQQFMGEIFVDTRVGKGSKFTFKILVQTIQEQLEVTESDIDCKSAKVAKLKRKINNFHR